MNSDTRSGRVWLLIAAMGIALALGFFGAILTLKPVDSSELALILAFGFATFPGSLWMWPLHPVLPDTEGAIVIASFIGWLVYGSLGLAVVFNRHTGNRLFVLFVVLLIANVGACYVPYEGSGPHFEFVGPVPGAVVEITAISPPDGATVPFTKPPGYERAIVVTLKCIVPPALVEDVFCEAWLSVDGVSPVGEASRHLDCYRCAPMTVSLVNTGETFTPLNNGQVITQTRYIIAMMVALTGSGGDRTVLARSVRPWTFQFR